MCQCSTCARTWVQCRAQGDTEEQTRGEGRDKGGGVPDRKSKDKADAKELERPGEASNGEPLSF